MIRFTSTQLRPVLSLRHGMKGPVILEKNNGIFLRRSDLRPQVKEPLAWAEGCNPLSDDGWRKLSDCLITEKYFFHQFDLSQEACDAVLNDHQDLLVSFICQTPGAVRVLPKQVSLRRFICQSAFTVAGSHGFMTMHYITSGLAAVGLNISTGVRRP